MARLEDKKLFLLDMDGTIYIDEDLFPGTIPFLDAVRERGGRYLFLTNNSSRSVDAYIGKLARMGIPSAREDFLTSVDALIADLAGRPPFRKCYAFGTRTFRQQLAEAGAREAFFRLKKTFPQVCLVHLYALEGAVTGQEYNQLPEETKRDLKAFSDFLKNGSV